MATVSEKKLLKLGEDFKKLIEQNKKLKEENKKLRNHISTLKYDKKKLKQDINFEKELVSLHECSERYTEAKMIDFYKLR